jgi:hypothetical protein
MLACVSVRLMRLMYLPLTAVSTEGVTLSSSDLMQPAARLLIRASSYQERQPVTQGTAYERSGRLPLRQR